MLWLLAMGCLRAGAGSAEQQNNRIGTEDRKNTNSLELSVWQNAILFVLGIAIVAMSAHVLYILIRFHLSSKAYSELSSSDEENDASSLLSRKNHSQAIVK